MTKCRHKVVVSDAGMFYDDFVCEACGNRVNETFWHVLLVNFGFRKIRFPDEGEMFYSDGVRKN